MLQEFKDFINRGNVIDLAVAVVLGAAFTPVVNAVVDGVLMQIVAAIFGEPDFSSLTFDLGDAAIAYGLVITTIVNFLFVALAMFFVVKAYNSLKSEAPVEEAPAGPSELDVLVEIRDALRTR
ncbi:MAG: large conductance mechanosensitive channel protein MscL [Actinomyces sp.]|nr:MAG: large conductance mechanosensitive channel protein MscL [Actinomyces sp.]